MDLNFFTIFSLSWVFSWQYKVGNYNLPKTLMCFYKQEFVKWWARFDASMASQENVTTWFKNNPRFLQIADPSTCKFLNQKARISAALAASTSEEDVLENLQNIVQLLQNKSTENIKEEQASSSSKKKNKKKKQVLPQSPPSSSDSFYQNEDDCYGIYSPINIEEEEKSE